MSKIGATIALDGEKQFKSAVTSAKQSLKELDSEMKLSSTVFKSQANSLDALREKHEILQRTLETHKQKSAALQKIVDAEKEKYEKAGTNLDKYSKELAEAQAELERMKTSGTATNEEIEEQQKVVDDLTQKVEKSTTAYESAERSVSRWQTQLNDTERDIAETNDAISQNEKYMAEAEKATDNCATSIDNYGREVKQAKDQTEGFADEILQMQIVSDLSQKAEKLANSISRIADAAYDAAKELDEGYDTIVKKTGATGEALEELETVANNIFGDMPAEMSDVGTAVGEVNTRFGYTGDELEALSTKFLKFADINETDVNTSIDMVQKDLAAFNMDASEAGDLLDAMTSVGQRTGVSMDTLQNSLVSNATVLQELGADAYGSLEFLGKLEMSGADSSSVMTGLSKALQNAVSQGIPLSIALEDLQNQLVNAADDTEGMRIATELFGTRAAAKVYPALKNGTINLQELSQVTEDYAGTVEDTYETTMDAWDEMTVAQNQLKTAGAQLAKSTLSTLAPAYTKASKVVSSFVDIVNDAPEPIKQTAGMLGLTTKAVSSAIPVISELSTIYLGITNVKKLSTAATAAQTAATIAETTATEGATAATTLFNGALAANPIGAIAIAIGVAAAALGAYALATSDAAEGINGLTDEMEESISTAEASRDALTESGNAIKSAYDSAANSISEAAAQSALAENLVGQLEELTSESSLTAEEQAKLQTVVSELNSIYPELGLQIDSTTGKLNKGAQEIKDYVQSMKDMTLARAYMEAYEDIIDEIVEAQKKQIEAEMQLDNLNDDLKDSTTTYNSVLKTYETANKRVTDAQDKLNKMQESGAATAEELEEANKELTDAQVALIGAENDLTIAGYDYENAQEALNAEIKETSDTIDEHSEAVTEATETAEKYREKAEELGYNLDILGTSTDTSTEYTNELADAQSGLGEAVEGAADAVSDATETQIQSYEELYAEVLESTQSASNAFKTYEEDTETSIQSMNDALTSQAEFYNNYADNINAVMSDSRYSTDENFRAMADSIMAMGEDGAAYMQAFVDSMEANDGTLEETLENFGNVNAAKENFASQMAEMQYGAQEGVSGVAEELSGGSTQISEAVDTWSTAADGSLASLGISARTRGAEVPQNLAYGISSGSGNVQSAASNVMNGAEAKLNESAAEATKAGSALSKNTATGIASGAGDVEKSVTNITTNTEAQMTAAETKAKTHGSSLASNYASGIKAGSTAAGTAATSLVNTALNAMSSNNSKSYTWGQELAQNFADGIRSKISAVKSAANDLAQAASDPIHHSTPSVGPLKHDDEWGYELAENFANAMLAGRGLVSDAAITLADAAAGLSDTATINVSPASEVDDRVISLLEAIAGKNGGGVDIVQNIFANSTSYADQQRQARRNFEEVAREIYT